jgi:UDP-hydrolysing UDP-N-acetyl-D-glucosamine 2-epimerase
MRKVCICYSGRGDLHLLNFLREELDKQFTTVTALYTDIVIVLGDRYEAMRNAVDAIRNKSILVHLHGGEVTQGSMDNVFRNAITKLAHYHFTATEQSKQRVIAMGEDPARVFNVGALGVERVKSLRKYPKKRNQILFIWHPSTINDKTAWETDIVIDALEQIDTEVIVFAPNLDPDYKVVAKKINAAFERNDNWTWFDDLGDDYIFEMEQSMAVVGNSSSGIIEAPSCGTMTVNIGIRQDKRECGLSVIRANIDRVDIIKAVDFAYSDGYFNLFKNPYDKPGTRKAISEFLLDCDLTFSK